MRPRWKHCVLGALSALLFSGAQAAAQTTAELTGHARCLHDAAHTVAIHRLALLGPIEVNDV